MGLITCNSCQAQISDAAGVCPYCGASVQNSTPAAKPPCPENYLARAIVVTFLCCWPFGIPAIVNAAAVSTAHAAGRYQEALEKSAKAKQWSNYSLIAGIIFWALYAIVMLIMVLAEL